MKNFEEYWKEHGSDDKDLSNEVKCVIALTKNLCQQAFEAGQKYEKEKTYAEAKRRIENTVE